MKNREWDQLSRNLNAWHYDEHPDYWQWLYFDFIFDNGYSAAAVVLPRSIGSIPGISLAGLTPEVWLTVLTPDGKRFDAKKAYPLADSCGEREGLNVQVGGNTLHYTENRYRIDLSVDEIGMELDLSPLLPPWSPLGENGFVNPSALQSFDPSGESYFNYIEFVPKGEVTGSLTLFDEEILVSGIGYHEQGRGNFPLCKLFRRWLWLKFWMDEFTFILPAGLFVPELFNSRLTFALLARGGEKLLDFMDFSPDIELIKESDFRIEPLSKSEYPGRMEFAFEKKGVSVVGSLKSGPMVESFTYTYPNYPESNPGIYLRFLAELELSVDIRGEKVKKTGLGMQEIMITGG